MSHKSIRLLLEHTANSLADDVQFSYGLTTDFNQSKKEGSILIHLDPLEFSPSYQVNGVMNYMLQWGIDIVFLKLDNIHDRQYVKVLDETQPFVDRFTNNLNFFSHKSDLITLSSFTVTPMIVDYADGLTGWRLQFSLLAADDFEYCTEC